MNMPLLYRAALQGVFGSREQYSRSSITDALFVYLDGDPEEESIDIVDSRFRNRPLMCLILEERDGLWYISKIQFIHNLNFGYAIAAWVPALALTVSLMLFGLSWLLF